MKETDEVVTRSTLSGDLATVHFQGSSDPRHRRGIASLRHHLSVPAPDPATRPGLPGRTMRRPASADDFTLVETHRRIRVAGGKARTRHLSILCFAAQGADVATLVDECWWFPEEGSMRGWWGDDGFALATIDPTAHGHLTDVAAAAMAGRLAVWEGAADRWSTRTGLVVAVTDRITADVSRSLLEQDVSAAARLVESVNPNLR